MSQSLYQAVKGWIDGETTIRAAVLFGSNASSVSGNDTSSQGSDFDFHIVTTEPTRLVNTDWQLVLPDHKYQMQCLRPATGGVQKLTVLFDAGQIDLIIVPQGILRLARIGMALGLDRHSAKLSTALNEINTCVREGYSVLKGEESWGDFYAKVASNFRGVRLSDGQMVDMANRAMVDFVWIRQKIDRGELSAAQHVLHGSLAEINFRLVRELRMRRGESLPSFGLGRNVERDLSAEELSWVRVDALCERETLVAAALKALAGLEALMGELVPTWKIPTLPELFQE